jgi:hypothetical protein
VDQNRFPAFNHETRGRSAAPPRPLSWPPQVVPTARRLFVHGQQAVPDAFRYIFWGDRHHRGLAQRGRYGLGAPGLRHRDGGPRAVGPKRISGHRKPHPERPAERPTDAPGHERSTLGETGHRLGRKVLAEVATVAWPDTLLAWYRKLVARKFYAGSSRSGPTAAQARGGALIISMASENRDWGYDCRCSAPTPKQCAHPTATRADHPC